MKRNWWPFAIGVLLGLLVGLLFERRGALAMERERCAAEALIKVQEETAEVAVRKTREEAASVVESAGRAVARAANEILHLREELRAAKAKCRKPQRHSRK